MPLAVQFHPAALAVRMLPLLSEKETTGLTAPLGPSFRTVIWNPTGPEGATEEAVAAIARPRSACNDAAATGMVTVLVDVQTPLLTTTFRVTSGPDPASNVTAGVREPLVMVPPLTVH